MAIVMERRSNSPTESNPHFTESKKKHALGVVVDSLNVGVDKLVPFIERVHLATKDAGVTDHHIYVSMHGGLDPKSEEIKEGLERKFPKLVTGLVVDDGTFAHAYTAGLQHAASHNHRVIEMDSGGGHLPEDIGRFIDGLDNHDVVLGSRFMSGGTNTYPLQRRIASRGVTALSNIVWGTDYYDAASGYQGFQAEILRKLFKVMPPAEWISAIKGPMHLYQTEARLYIHMMGKALGVSVMEVPIRYGAEKKGSSLGIPYYLASLSCFLDIGSNRRVVEDRLKSYIKK